MSAASIEFRIPISPTRAFFHQVRFFEYALRRLGGIYREAKLVVVVGDNVDLEFVTAQNLWSANRNVEWLCVPRGIFDRYGIHGTADYRYFPETTADLVILSDADTVLTRDIDPLVAKVDPQAAWIGGHMAHSPPPPIEVGSFSGLSPDQLWPQLLKEFDLQAPEALQNYSISGAEFIAVPPYFNLGFIALTQPALRLARDSIFEVQDHLLRVYPSNMRCQIALTLIALRAGMAVQALPAEYNLANDIRHLEANSVAAEDARVIHYLRREEIRREDIVLPELASATQATMPLNPVNRVLLSLLRDHMRATFGIG